MFSIAPMWKGELQLAPTRMFSERSQICMQIQRKTSWAWCEYVCARCRGELQFALCSCVRFCLESPMFSIAPMWKGELQFAPTRVLSKRWQISCKYV